MRKTGQARQWYETAEMMCYRPVNLDLPGHALELL